MTRTTITNEVELPPMVVMTCDKSDWTLDGFFYLLKKYCQPLPEVIIYGYRKPQLKTEVGAWFVRIGDFATYPPNRWSDSLLIVLDDLAVRGHTHFWLMLDDYWIVRHVDTLGIHHLYRYMRRSDDIIKIDLCSDRLYAYSGEPYLYNRNNYDHCHHMDLIQSITGSPYHLSFWGGIWNRELLRRFIIPGERAQEIEIAGSTRLSQHAQIKVLGTRQIPLLHTNILQGGKPPNYLLPLPIQHDVLGEMSGMGYVRNK